MQRHRYAYACAISFLTSPNGEAARLLIQQSGNNFCIQALVEDPPFQ